MASIISSARTSTASLFDVVGSSAKAIVDLANVGVVAVDMLALKTNALHAQVVVDTAIANVDYENVSIAKAASRYADSLEEIHRRNNPGIPFDRAKTVAGISFKMENEVRRMQGLPELVAVEEPKEEGA